MKLFYIDLEQAESRTVGAIIYRLFGETAYLDAQESGDPHTLVCSMAWKHLPWPEDFSLAKLQSSSDPHFPADLVKAAKKIANGKAYREMSYRDLAKRLSHGTNYYGKPPQMAKHTHVDVKIIRNFQREYFDAFPGIQRWHRNVAESIQVDRYITTVLGRRRFFFGRPDDDATLREAIAYEPQSVATGDYMNYGLYQLWLKNYPLLLQAQVHDAVSASYDEQDEHWLIPAVCEILETKFPIYSPEGKERMFSIPTEPLVGWNLSYANAKNPDGLIVYHGEDKRKRTNPIYTSIKDFKLS